MALCVPIMKYREIKRLRDDAVKKVEEVTKTCCIPIERYRYMKRMHTDALKKFEEVTKEFEELKETTEEYKQKYEDLMHKMENPGGMSLGGGDQTDGGGQLLLEEEGFKDEAAKHDPWPAALKVKDLAKMSIEYLHSGEIRRDTRGSKASLKGTLSFKPLEVTIINLSKKTVLQLGASFFKSGRFSLQPTGSIEAGESQTYTISSKDGRAKTGVKGGLAFIVYDVKVGGEEEEEVVENEDGEEKQDEMNGEKKDKKKSKKEKKEKKRKEKKSKKEKKKAKEEGEEKENKEVEEEENKEENMEENQENGEHDVDETIPEENEDGTVTENKDEENQPKDVSTHEEHEEEDLPEGNGDFFICAFENPLAGVAKAKCNKTESKDILPVVKQLKNDKPIQQDLFGYYKGGKRHLVFIWKDDEVEW